VADPPPRWPDELGDLPRRRELLLGREAGLRGVVEDGLDRRSFRRLPDLPLYCRVAELVAQYRVPGLRLEGDPGLSHGFRHQADEKPRAYRQTAKG
jgi:hypothetical protein